MKRLIVSLSVLMMSATAFAAQDSLLANLNVGSDGVAIHGYDLVDYFAGNVQQGSASFETVYNGAKYRFESQENENQFIANPEYYLPQYGGWCATAMAMDMKLDFEPHHFLISDGKLYLFSLVNGNDARQMWLMKPTELKPMADQNWWRRIEPKGSKELQNLQSGDVAVHGYDLISYREGTPVLGSPALVAEHDGIYYHFATPEHLAKFQMDPDAFTPEYGGWCATAMSMGMLLDVDPTSYVIENGRLFLFSHVNGQDARAMWLANPSMYTQKADAEWDRRINSR